MNRRGRLLYAGVWILWFVATLAIAVLTVATIVSVAAYIFVAVATVGVLTAGVVAVRASWRTIRGEPSVVQIDRRL